VIEPGPLIAAGRSADILDAGEGRVVRRRRGGPIPEREVAAMRAAHTHGFPVPEVFGVDGADMLMERVDGIDLLTRLGRRPWEVRRIARVLAELHVRLASIPVDQVDVATVIEPREALVHGDLHPGNVLVAGRGPVVIDWEGAGTGPRDADIATTWLLLSIADADDVPVLVRPFVNLVRAMLVRGFLAGVARPRPETVRAVCDDRLGDPNMRPHERDRIRRFRAEHG
jgi:aminoglycoside phosphotransferase (APT) family kinase protein